MRRPRAHLVALLSLLFFAALPAQATRTLPSLADSYKTQAPLELSRHSEAASRASEKTFALFDEEDLSLFAASSCLDRAENRIRLFADSGEIGRPAERFWGQKTAVPASMSAWEANIRAPRDLAQIHVDLFFQGAWTDPITGIAYHRNRWYDPRTASWLSEDPAGAVDSPNLYAFVGWGPQVYTDPLGEDVEVIVGRPYRKTNGEWAPYGHVAIRVFDPEKHTYDFVYDFGRYGKAWGFKKSKGEGILNVQGGEEYIARESRHRSNVGYVTETAPEEDKKIMKHFQKLASEGKRRADIEKKLGYRNSKTYQLVEDYDAAVFSAGIGGNTCVTQTRDGCEASDADGLEAIASAVDETYPEEVEKNLEKLFRKKDTPITERRTYRKAKSGAPTVIPHGAQQGKSREELEKEDKERKRLWEAQK